MWQLKRVKLICYAREDSSKKIEYFDQFH